MSERAFDRLSLQQQERILEGRSLPLKPISPAEIVRRQEVAAEGLKPLVGSVSQDALKRYAITRGLN